MFDKSFANYMIWAKVDGEYQECARWIISAVPDDGVLTMTRVELAQESPFHGGLVLRTLHAMQQISIPLFRIEGDAMVFDYTEEQVEYCRHVRNALSHALPIEEIRPVEVPDGLVKCPECGEYRGQVRAGDLYWEQGTIRPDPDKVLPVTCICDGILCKRCKTNKIHRPTSNQYDEEENAIGHLPYFAAMIPCRECREAEDNETTSGKETNHE